MKIALIFLIWFALTKITSGAPRKHQSLACYCHHTAMDAAFELESLSLPVTEPFFNIGAHHAKRRYGKNGSKVSKHRKSKERRVKPAKHHAGGKRLAAKALKVKKIAKRHTYKDKSGKKTKHSMSAWESEKRMCGGRQKHHATRKHPKRTHKFSHFKKNVSKLPDFVFCKNTTALPPTSTFSEATKYSINMQHETGKFQLPGIVALYTTEQPNKPSVVSVVNAYMTEQPNKAVVASSMLGNMLQLPIETVSTSRQHQFTLPPPTFEQSTESVVVSHISTQKQATALRLTNLQSNKLAVTNGTAVDILQSVSVQAQILPFTTEQSPKGGIAGPASDANVNVNASAGAPMLNTVLELKTVAPNITMMPPAASYAHVFHESIASSASTEQPLVLEATTEVTAMIKMSQIPSYVNVFHESIASCTSTEQSMDALIPEIAGKKAHVNNAMVDGVVNDTIPNIFDFLYGTERAEKLNTVLEATTEVTAMMKMSQTPSYAHVFQESIATCTGTEQALDVLIAENAGKQANVTNATIDGVVYVTSPNVFDFLYGTESAQKLDTVLETTTEVSSNINMPPTTSYVQDFHESIASCISTEQILDVLIAQNAGKQANVTNASVDGAVNDNNPNMFYLLNENVTESAQKLEATTEGSPVLKMPQTSSFVHVIHESIASCTGTEQPLEGLIAENASKKANITETSMDGVVKNRNPNMFYFLNATESAVSLNTVLEATTDVSPLIKMLQTPSYDQVLRESIASNERAAQPLDAEITENATNKSNVNKAVFSSTEKLNSTAALPEIVVFKQFEALHASNVSSGLTTTVQPLSDILHRMLAATPKSVKDAAVNHVELHSTHSEASNHTKSTEPLNNIDGAVESSYFSNEMPLAPLPLVAYTSKPMNSEIKPKTKSNMKDADRYNKQSDIDFITKMYNFFHIW